MKYKKSEDLHYSEQPFLTSTMDEDLPVCMETAFSGGTFEDLSFKFLDWRDIEWLWETQLEKCFIFGMTPWLNEEDEKAVDEEEVQGLKCKAMQFVLGKGQLSFRILFQNTILT